MNKDAGTLQSRTGGQPIENILYTTTKMVKEQFLQLILVEMLI